MVGRETMLSSMMIRFFVKGEIVSLKVVWMDSYKSSCRHLFVKAGG